jgi:hypothetical protein
MNPNTNDPEIAAAMKAVKASADDHKIVLNEAAINYAARRLPRLRAEDPALPSDEAVYRALKEFPLSEEGIDYCLSLVKVFIESYRVLVGKRLSWAGAEGFIPPQSAPMLASIIASRRIDLIQEGKFRFSFGNPLVATPATAEELAAVVARHDVDDNLPEFSKLMHAKPGDSFMVTTVLRGEV